MVFTFDEVRISADELLVRIIRHALFELHEALVRAHEDVFAVVPRNNADRRINRGGIQRIHFELIDNLELRIQEENIVFRSNYSTADEFRSFPLKQFEVLSLFSEVPLTLCG